MVAPQSRRFLPVTHNVIHKNCALFASARRPRWDTRRDQGPGAPSRRLNIQRLGVRAALIVDYERQGLLQFADTGLRERVYAMLEHPPHGGATRPRRLHALVEAAHTTFLLPGLTAGKE